MPYEVVTRENKEEILHCLWCDMSDLWQHRAYLSDISDVTHFLSISPSVIFRTFFSSVWVHICKYDTAEWFIRHFFCVVLGEEKTFPSTSENCVMCESSWNGSICCYIRRQAMYTSLRFKNISTDRKKHP